MFVDNVELESARAFFKGQKLAKKQRGIPPHRSMSLIVSGCICSFTLLDQFLSQSTAKTPDYLLQWVTPEYRDIRNCDVQ